MGISITINAENAEQAREEMETLLRRQVDVNVQMKAVNFDPGHVHAGAGPDRTEEPAAEVPAPAPTETPTRKRRTKAEIAADEAAAAAAAAPAEPEAPTPTADSLLDDEATEFALYDCGGDTINMHASLDAWRVGFVEHLADIHDGDQVKQFCQNNAAIANTLPADEKLACNKAAEARLIELTPRAAEPAAPAKPADQTVDATAVRKVLAEAIDKKGIETCADILKQFDATKFSELKPEHYAAFVAKCTEAMGA